MSMHQCHACRRTDVRLYRSYGSFLRDEDIVCNAHLPTTDGKPDTSWMVPLIEAPDGSVWGYTSCPDSDIATWKAKPDANPHGPTWGGGSWLPAVPALTGLT